MSGSGGSFFGSNDAKKAIEQIKKSEKQTQNAELDGRVSEYIVDLLKEYNDRDVEQIQQHLDSIKKALEKEIDGTVDLLFAGSISKHTFIDGLSDVDSLVILDNCNLATESPETAKAYLAQRLSERFPNTPVREGDLAVTCLLYTSPSPRDGLLSRMPSSA